MKNLLLFLIICLASQTIGFAQVKNDSILMKAMNDELKNNMERLSFDKYKPPFYMAYQVTDSRFLIIRATLGSIVQSQDNTGRSNNMRLMVGDYSMNDENFSGGGGYYSSGYLPIPAEDDYAAIRRAFWSMSDQVYKSAINNYEQKQIALKQQINNNTEKLDDYSRITPLKKIMDVPQVTFDKTKWENVAKNISAEFKTYKDIFSSQVNILFVNATFYNTTSEGTQLRYPFGVAYITVRAETQADDGEPLEDYLEYCSPTPDQLPSADQIKNDIKKLSENLLALKKAQAIEESFSGPVIFEKSAVAELFASLFDENGLIASREPVSMYAGPSVGNFSKFENKINQRVCPENITIASVPKTREFKGIPLVGAYEADAEGVVPGERLILVEKGILKTLLNDRIPTHKVKESNGHCRVDVLRGSTDKAPGVADITYENGKPMKTLVKQAQKEAQKNGLEHFYIIRSLDKNSVMGFSGGNISKPISIYKVSVKTGEEQLVRSAFISEFEVADFKKIIGGTKEQFVYNTIFASGRGSFATSFIVPEAILFSEIAIEKNKGTQPQKPVVPNPL